MNGIGIPARTPGITHQSRWSFGTLLTTKRRRRSSIRHLFGGALLLANAEKTLRRADEELALADGDRGAEHGLAVTHLRSVQQSEFPAGLHDEDLACPVHHVNLAVGRGGRGLESLFALESARPDDFAGRINAK